MIQLFFPICETAVGLNCHANLQYTILKKETTQNLVNSEELSEHRLVQVVLK